MTGATYFLQDCPTCCRPLRIRVELLGRPVRCQHCGREFTAQGHAPLYRNDPAESLLQRAEQLLDEAQDPTV